MNIQESQENPPKKSSWWIIIIILIILVVVFGFGFFGGKQGQKEGASCNFGIGKTFCWIWQKTTLETQYDCSSNVYNCGDFTTQAEAQAVYDYCSPTAGDIHRLDNDGDGKVCEGLE